MQKTLQLFKTKQYQEARTTAVTSLLKRLQSLCDFLNQEVERERIEMLISCAGPGLMLAFYKAGVSSAAPKSLAQVLPPNTCQMDVQGSISVVGQHAMIKVGEIKSSMSGKRKAKTQIQVRANLVKWAVQILFNEVTEVAVQGHIFVSKDVPQDDAVTAAPYVLEDISIFVHHL